MYKKAWEALEKKINAWQDFEDRQLDKAIEKHDEEGIANHATKTNTLAMLKVMMRNIKEGE